MRVFVTGGTGFVGSAIVRDLLGAGHEVLALARSDASAAALRSAHADVHRGSLEDVDSLRAGADAADAVIHTAFDNSAIVRFPKNSKMERAGLQAIGALYAGSDRPIVAAGGLVPVVASGPVLTEADEASPNLGPVGRNVERTIMGLVDSGVNASIVRMPCVHGDGDRFTLPRFIELARKHGESGYVGTGSNLLPAVHNTDAAAIFRLAVERGVPGSRYHAVAEEGVPYKGIAEVIGRRLNVPAVSMSRLKARRHFGLYTAYAESDRPATSTVTRDQLGWEPAGPELLLDLDRAEYFNSRS